MQNSSVTPRLTAHARCPCPSKLQRWHGRIATACRPLNQRPSTSNNSSNWPAMTSLIKTEMKFERQPPASQPASLTTILMIVDQAWGLTTNDNNWPTPSSINCHRDGRKGQPKAKYDLLSCHRLLPAIFDGSIWLLVACGCLQLIVVLDICQLQAATCLPYLQFKLPWEHHRVYVGYILHWAINPNQRVSQFTCQK